MNVVKKGNRGRCQKIKNSVLQGCPLEPKMMPTLTACSVWAVLGLDEARLKRAPSPTYRRGAKH
jgi:hypothetical protein